ncbi:DUF533 domain-containing protein [Neoroseomonas lacus]|uniref:Tellurite resistance TerB family protein n=1 Tax=Neoroseomonas lacus TaxID=287609 RepID=A0A917KIV5_9PROT|nr:DUF533 domain-containing protein [Neoroseomonas lacus]GGJ13109.1 hypothetical protein GCM10011320_20440 [Neoroseomonas lacus]
MAQFDLGGVLGAMLGGTAATRGTRRRGGKQDLNRALAMLAGAAIEAMTKPQQPAPPPPRPRTAKPTTGWDDAVPTRKPAPTRASVPPSGSPWGTPPTTKPAPTKPARATDAWSPTPGTPPPPPIAAEDREALLMLRAMIAAAKADGLVDADERARIADQLDAAGLTPAGRDTVLAQFEQTATPEALAREATDPMLAAQLYAAAVAGTATIEGAERAWLDTFAKALRLDRAATEAIERRIRGT